MRNRHKRYRWDSVSLSMGSCRGRLSSTGGEMRLAFSICPCQVAARDATDKEQPVEMGAIIKSGRLTQFGLEEIQSLFLRRADAIMKECFESQNINILN